MNPLNEDEWWIIFIGVMVLALIGYYGIDQGPWPG